LIGACGFYTTYKGSKPVLAGEIHQTPVVELDGLDLNIRVFNDIRDFQMVNSVVLVPVYVSGKDEAVYESQEEFFVLLGYRPHKEGFTFDPKKTWLVTDGKKLEASVEDAWKNPVSRFSSKWTGFCGKPIPDSYERISRDPVPRDDSGFWHCYNLKFDLSPPNPSDKFGLIIEGMTRDETLYPIPVIWFEEYIWHHNDSVP
jgi:hypothetical protein